MFDTVPLNQPLDIKFIVRTKAGTLVKKPGQIQATNTSIEFLRSPFELKDEIKSMKGARWHGFEDPPRKIWTVSNCLRNWFQLRYLLGEDVFAWFDRPLQQFEYERPLMAHQKVLADSGLTYHYQIWGAEMGCIDGDAIVHVNRAKRGFEITLRELCYKFHGGRTSTGKRGLGTTYGNQKWSTSIETNIRSFRGNCLGLTKIKDVLFQGKKLVKKITTQSNKSLRLTADHEVCVNAYRYGTFKAVQSLKVGDLIMVAAPENFKKNNLVIVEQRVPSDLKKTTKQGGSFHLDKNGYVLVCGLPKHHRAVNSGKVREHILVMEELLGRKILIGEEIHHLNSQKWDNRPENLVLCNNHQDHVVRFHNRQQEKFFNGKKAPDHYFIFEPIISIEDAGETDVYDIQCERPYHNFVANDIVVHNCGKTLSAIEVMERSGKQNWFWIGPRSGLYAVEREFKKWCVSDNFDVEFMTYEGLVKRMENWDSSQKAPMGVVFDESSRCKSPNAKRTMAAQALADGVRKDWGFEGYVILMSGTPSPKSPADWHSQVEIAWPGFLREGSRSAFEFRLGIYRKEEGMGGTAFHKLVTWRDDERKCDICGEFAEKGKHRHLLDVTNQYLEADPEIHDFKSSINEVELIYERLKDLVIIQHKKNCLDLPDKRYRIIQCEPKPSTLRVAQALLQTAPNTITGLTWLRELSDGFQYRNKVVGKETCPTCEGTCRVSYWVDPQDSERAFTMTDMLDPEYVATLNKQLLPCVSCNGTGEVDRLERTVKEVPCPKDEALISLLEENEETGRLVVFAGFTGSIDKITALCLKQGWDVVRVDGRGWQVRTKDGIQNEVPLDYWADLVNHQRVCFVAHPKSGGMSLTLVEARMAVYFSNSYETESRTQSEDRIHRIGTNMNKGATIVDLIHLPTDLKVLELLRDNRRLELMSMGGIQKCFEGVGDGET